MRETKDKWMRVDRQNPCPICDKPDWCTLSPDSSLACCMRQDQGALKALSNGGWLHRLIDQPKPYRARPKPPTLAVIALPDLPRMDASRMQKEAGALGVAPVALEMLDIRVHGGNPAFPMRDADNRVIGYRIRTQEGKKFSVNGSQNGLFIPQVETWKPKEEPLFIVEGPTDTAALLSLQLWAIGRPSNTGGLEMLAKFAKPFRQVAILADRDANDLAQKATASGAIRLAETLPADCRVKIFHPPCAKDARKWMQQGATLEVILTVWRNAKEFRPRRHSQNSSPTSDPLAYLHA